MLIGIDANEANLTTHRVGVNQYAFSLLHSLYSEPGPYHYVIYLKSPPQPDLPPARPGWSYRVIPFPRLWTQTRLPFDLYLHRPRPDLFFSMTHYSPRFAPMPRVVAIMDLGFLLYPDQFTPQILNQLTTWTEYSVKKATRIIAISENTKHDIIKFYHRSPSDIDVTYLGYDDQVFHPVEDAKVLAKYGITRPYFLFLSSLKPSKNVEGLIRGFAQFPNQEYELVIAGKKAWMYDQIFALVKQLGLENRVIFTNFVSSGEAPVLMTMSSGFVLPSFYEGFALPCIEAMACGTPVAVSQVANLPEIAGKAVVYLDPHNPSSITQALVELTGPRRSALIKAGLAQAKLFTWQNTAQATLQTFAKILTT